MGTHGIVLGGGVAGLLAAAALNGAVDEVTVVERDRFSDAPRKGVPQGWHAHLLLARGLRAMDELLPGTGAALSAAGARRVGMPRDLLTFTPFGWMPRFPHGQFLISCRRPVLESVLRAGVRRDGRVAFLEETEAVGLEGTSALVRDRRTGAVRALRGDLVVDATGASSKADRWLGAVPAVVVDAGIRYATRVYRPPAGLVDAFPAVCVQPDPAGAGHGGVVLPIEDGRWIVSLAGLRGHVPPTDDEGFTAFAGGLRHRLIADLIATAEPLGPVRGYGAPPSRLRRLDRVRAWPRGFVVLGDAVSTYNPLYGHGMTVAALHALALRDGLRRHGLGPDLAESVRRAVGGATADAWALASGQDTRYARTSAPPRRLPDRIGGWYADRVGAAAAVRPEVTAALLDAYTLSVPLSRLLRPRTVLSVLATRKRPDGGPPLTPDEERLLRATPRQSGDKPAIVPPDAESI